MSFQKPEDFQKCQDCKFPMRPRGALKKDFPDTRAWGHSGSCKSCIQPRSSRNFNTTPKEIEIPMATRDDEFGYDEEDLTGFHEEDPTYRQRKVPPEVRLANTVSGLEAFMARRHQRVQPEAVNPIVWGRSEEKKAA